LLTHTFSLPNLLSTLLLLLLPLVSTQIPGNSTAAWRARVRTALEQALDKLGGDEAAAACEVVMQEATYSV
jgi:hypothetical protein